MSQYQTAQLTIIIQNALDTQLPIPPTLPSVISIAIAGFPAIPFAMPLKLDGYIPDIDIEYLIQSVYQDLRQFLIKTLTDFVVSLPLVGATIGTLPNIGTIVGALGLGTICYDDETRLPI